MFMWVVRKNWKDLFHHLKLGLCSVCWWNVPGMLEAVPIFLCFLKNLSNFLSFATENY